MVGIITGLGLGTQMSSLTQLGSSEGEFGNPQVGGLGENVYVNAATGNLVIERTDEILSAIGITADLTSVYNSLAPSSGYGLVENSETGTSYWQSNASTSISALTGTLGTSGSYVQMTNPDGSVATYYYTSKSGSNYTYVSTQYGGAGNTLIFNSTANHWSWKDPAEKISRIYDEAANGTYYLYQTADDVGNTLTYSWNAGGQLTQIKSSDGEYISLAYGTNGSGDTQITVSLNYYASQSAETSGVYTTLSNLVYTYDNNNRLSTIAAYTSSGSSDTITYGYAANSGITQNEITSISQTGGEDFTIAYNASGQVTSVAETLASGVVSTTSFSYNSATDTTSITDESGNVTKLTYDSTGDLTEVLLPAAQTGATAQTMSYSYNGDNDVLTQTDAGGNVTTNTYYSNDMLETSTDPLGNETTYTYNTQEQVLTYTIQNSADTQVSTTRYGYNSLQERAFMINNDGEVTSYLDTSSGEVSAVTQYPNDTYAIEAATLGGTATAGDVLSITLTPASGSPITFSITVTNGETTAQMASALESAGLGSSAAAAGFQFTANSNVLMIYGPSGWTYSEAISGAATETVALSSSLTGLAQIQSPTSLTAWIDDITDSNTTDRYQYTYDWRGNLEKSTNFQVADNSSYPYETTNYVYNQSGDLTSQVVTDGTGAAYTSTYTYDWLNRVLTATTPDGNTTTTTYNDSGDTVTVAQSSGLSMVDTYNLADQLISSQQSGADTVTATTTYSYNDAGNIYDQLGELAAVTDPNGNTTYYLYDKVGRQVATIAPNGAMSRTIYTQDNQVAAIVTYANLVTSGHMTTIEATNSHGQLENPALSSVLPTTSSSDIWDWNIYDADGDLIQTINGDGYTTVNSYDTFGNLTQVSVYATPFSSTAISGFQSSPPSTFQSPTADAGEDQTTRFFYNSEGQVVGVLNGDGYLTENIYNNSGQKIQTTLFATQASSSLWASGAFAQLLSNVGTTAQDQTTQYFYDGRGLLLYTLSGDLIPTQYVYDDAGNLVETLQYGGPIASALSSLTLASLQSAISSAGLATNALNRTTWNVYDTATGKLDFAINGVGAVTEYTYNATGQVVQTTQFATLDPRTSLPSLSTMQSWATSNASGASITSNVYNAAGQIAFTIDPDGNVTGYLYDADGHVIQETQYAIQDPVTSSPSISTMESWASSNSAGASVTSSVYNALGQLAFTIDPLGDVTAYAYNTYGRVIQTISYVTQDPVASAPSLSAMQSWASANASNTRNRITYSVYDAAGRLAYSLSPANYASGEFNYAVTQFQYNANGQVVAQTQFATLDSVSSLPTLSAMQGWASTNGPDGQNEITYTVYDPADRVAYALSSVGVNSPTDPTSQSFEVTGYQYDAAGQVVGVTQFATLDNLSFPSSLPTYSAMNSWNSGSVASNSGNRYSYNVYDAAGQLAYSLVSSTYDTTHNQVDFAVTGYQYNMAGQVLTETKFATLDSVTAPPTLPAMYSWNSGGVASDTQNRITQYVYNGAGNLVYKLTPTNDTSSNYYYAVTAYIYSATGQMTKQSIYMATYYEINSTTPITTGVTAAQVASMVSGSTEATQYAYDAAGQLTQTTNAAGIVTAYTYDAFGNMLSLTVASGTAEAATTNYTYDADNHLLTTSIVPMADEPAVTTSLAYNAFGEVATSTDGNGNVTTNYYDNAGEVTSTVDGAGATTSKTYDAFGNVATTVSGNGNTTYYFYDGLNRLILEVGPAVNTSEPGQTANYASYATGTTYTIGNEIASVTHYGNPVTVTGGQMPTITADPGVDAMTTFTRDLVGRVTSEEDAVGNTQSWTYDAFGDQASYTNQLGGETGYAYDNRGLVLSETLTENTYEANAISTPTATSVTNTYTYDAFGNKTQMVQASGLAEAVTTNYTYTLLNQLSKQTGQSATVTNPTTLGTSSVTPTTYYYYDDRGNLIETIDPTTATIYTYYDSMNRKIAQVDAMGDLTTWAYDGNSNVTTLTQYGTQITASDDITSSTPVSTLLSDAPGSANRVTAYTYDGDDRLISTLIQNILIGSYSGGAYTTATTNLLMVNTYDSDGNLAATQSGTQTVSESGTTTTFYSSTFYYYNAADQKIAEVDPDNYVTFYDLDYNGNTTQEIQYATALTSAPTTTTTWSTVSGGIHSSSGDRKTDYTYDLNGNRLTESRENVTTYQVGSTGGLTANSFTNSKVTWTYNGMGEVTSTTQMTGEETTYTYDSMGRLTLTQESAYSGVNASGTAATVQNTTANYYNGINNLVETVEYDADQTSNSRITTYTYGADGWLATMTDPTGFVRTYGYDADGRTTAVTYTLTQPDGLPAVTFAQVTEYDALGRTILNSVATKSGSTWTLGDQYGTSYDAFGDVSTQSVNGLVQVTNTYDLAGRLSSTVTNNGSMELFLHDSLGNQTMAVTSSGVALPTGYSWPTLTTSQAITLLTVGGAIAGGDTTSNGVTATFTTYDARGEALSVIAPYRELSENSSGVYTTATITTLKTYDAFGDVASSTDGNGNKTSDYYNSLGDLTEVSQPSVSYTYVNSSQNIVTGSKNPTTVYYYDASGRQVGTLDPNGYTTSQTLLANTGYNGAPALALKTFNPDNSTTSNLYDVFGDVAQSTDGDGDVTTYQYNGDGKLTQETLPATPANTPGNSTSSAVQLTETYVYDGLGQRIESYNNLLTSSAAQETQYDGEGRIIAQYQLDGTNPDRYTTTYSYVWSASLTDATGFASGGWTKTTAQQDGATSAQEDDTFGNVLQVSDDVANDTFDTYSYSYDLAGRLIKEFYPGNGTTTPDTTTYSYFNTNQVASELDYYKIKVTHKQQTGGDTIYWDIYSLTSTYAYDNNGNRTLETYGSSTTIDFNTVTASYENATATYDALNRMTTLSDTGNNGTAPITINWYYDLDSNVTNQVSTYYAFSNSNGNRSSTKSTQNYWFEYDKMNRVTLDDGIDQNGTIDRGPSGTNYSYDAAGRRVNSSTTLTGTQWDGSTYYGTQELQYTFQTQQENYIYTPSGGLAKTTVQLGTVTDSSTSTYVQPGAASGTAYLQSTYQLDAMGRVTSLSEYNSTGTSVVYSKTATYDVESDVATDQITTVRTNNSTYVQSDTYSYQGSFWNGTEFAPSGYEGAYASTINTSVTVNNGTATNSETENSYGWVNGNMTLDYITYYPNTANKGTAYTTSFDFDNWGLLTSANVDAGTYYTNNYIENPDGQILTNISTAGPASEYYFFGNKQEGLVSNNGTSNVTYAQSIANETAVPGSGYFANGASSGTPSAAFGTDSTEINSSSGDVPGAAYTVQQGDTLEGIAQALLGDSSYWYLIADANGISGDGQLSVGETLTIPTLVNNTQNTSSSSTVYNPSQALGNVSPTHPPNPHHGGCGILGEILLMVIAVAVSFLVTPAITAAMQGLFGAIGLDTGASVAVGAAGDLASATTDLASATADVADGVGDISDVFDAASEVSSAASNFSAVMATQVAPGIFAGSDAAIAGAAVGGAIGGAAGSLVSQGVGLAFGLQSKFSWSGLAESAIGGAVNGGLGSSGANVFGTVSSSPFVVGVLQGAAENAVTQGLEVATGLQKSFNWADVAAAGAEQGVSDSITANSQNLIGSSPTSTQTLFTSGVAGALASAVTKTALGSGSFGANFASAIPDAIGATIGGMIAEGIQEAQNRATMINLLTQYGGMTADEAEQNVDAFEKFSGIQPGDINLLNQGTNGWNIGAISAIKEALEQMAADLQVNDNADEDAAFRKAIPIFDAAFASADVYFNSANSAILPNWMTRITDPTQLLRIGLTPDIMVDNSSGFYSAVYQDDQQSGMYLLADRGTVDIKSWIANFAQGLGKESTQYTEAMAEANDIVNQVGADDVDFVGHSLGGGLAAAQAVETGAHAIVFDEAGVNIATIARLNSSQALSNYNNAAAFVTNYDTTGEILDFLQDNKAYIAGGMVGIAATALISGHPISATELGELAYYAAYAPTEIGQTIYIPTVDANGNAQSTGFFTTPIQSRIDWHSLNYTFYGLSSLFNLNQWK